MQPPNSAATHQPTTAEGERSDEMEMGHSSHETLSQQEDKPSVTTQEDKEKKRDSNTNKSKHPCPTSWGRQHGCKPPPETGTTF